MDFDGDVLRNRIEDFRDISTFTDREIAKTYELHDTRDWKLSLKRQAIAQDVNWESYFTECLYRPFDIRSYYHSKHVVEVVRDRVMSSMVVCGNLGFVSSRQQLHVDTTRFMVGVSDKIINDCVPSNKTKETNYVFPPYINVGLAVTRSITNSDFCHVLCSNEIVEVKLVSHDRASHFFPLYCLLS